MDVATLSTSANAHGDRRDPDSMNAADGCDRSGVCPRSRSRVGWPERRSGRPSASALPIGRPKRVTWRESSNALASSCSTTLGTRLRALRVALDALLEAKARRLGPADRAERPRSGSEQLEPGNLAGRPLAEPGLEVKRPLAQRGRAGERSIAAVAAQEGRVA